MARRRRPVPPLPSSPAELVAADGASVEARIRNGSCPRSAPCCPRPPSPRPVETHTNVLFSSNRQSRGWEGREGWRGDHAPSVLSSSSPPLDSRPHFPSAQPLEFSLLILP